jgi:uncharacterized protein
MNLIWAAISLGFLGSFHCVGMCGPIALALPVNHNSLSSKTTGALLYNFGRILTYAIFGALFGMIGQGIVIAGYQQLLSISLGALIILLIFLPSKLFSRFRLTTPIYSFVFHLKQKFGELLKNKSYSSLFLIGVLNGLLPCGLVYLGVAGAIATGNGFQGALFMAMFGLGTLPAMFALVLAGNSVSVNFRTKINKAMPVFIVAVALLLILRGMNLGIPYVSPEMAADKPVCHKCCHK